MSIEKSVTDLTENRREESRKHGDKEKNKQRLESETISFFVTSEQGPEKQPDREEKQECEHMSIQNMASCGRDKNGIANEKTRTEEAKLKCDEEKKEDVAKEQKVEEQQPADQEEENPEKEADVAIEVEREEHEVVEQQPEQEEEHEVVEQQPEQEEEHEIVEQQPAEQEEENPEKEPDVAKEVEQEEEHEVIEQQPEQEEEHEVVEKQQEQEEKQEVVEHQPKQEEEQQNATYHSEDGEADPFSSKDHQCYDRQEQLVANATSIPQSVDVPHSSTDMAAMLSMLQNSSPQMLQQLMQLCQMQQQLTSQQQNQQDLFPNYQSPEQQRQEQLIQQRWVSSQEQQLFLRPPYKGQDIFPTQTVYRSQHENLTLGQGICSPGVPTYHGHNPVQADTTSQIAPNQASTQGHKTNLTQMFAYQGQNPAPGEQTFLSEMPTFQNQCQGQGNQTFPTEISTNQGQNPAHGYQNIDPLSLSANSGQIPMQGQQTYSPMSTYQFVSQDKEPQKWNPMMSACQGQNLTPGQQTLVPHSSTQSQAVFQGLQIMDPRTSTYQGHNLTHGQRVFPSQIPTFQGQNPAHRQQNLVPRMSASQSWKPGHYSGTRQMSPYPDQNKAGTLGVHALASTYQDRNLQSSSSLARPKRPSPSSKMPDKLSLHSIPQPLSIPPQKTSTVNVVQPIIQEPQKRVEHSQKSHSTKGSKAVNAQESTLTGQEKPVSPSQIESTVTVRGFSTKTTGETLELYFESKRKSGGGPVQYIHTDTINQGVVFVTFEKAEDAARVVQQEKHILHDCELKVSFGKPPEQLKDRVLVKGLPDYYYAGDLRVFMEGITGGTVEEICFYDETGQPRGEVALVRFEKDIDGDLIGTFLGNTLTFDKLIQSNTVVVHGLDKGCYDKDHVTSMFESKTGDWGGNAVDNTEICEDQGYCLVTFVEPAAAKSVEDIGKKREHNIKPISVSMYFDFLGPFKGRPEPFFIIPQPFPLPENVSTKLLYIQQIPTLKQEVMSLLENMHASLDSPKSKVLKCCIPKEVQNARYLAKTWASDVKQALDKYMGQIVFREETLTSVEYSPIAVDLKEMATKASAGVFYESTDSKLIILVKVENQTVVGDITRLISAKREELEREKGLKSRSKLWPVQKVQMLCKRGIDPGILSSYPKLQVTFNHEEGFIALNGLEPEINYAADVIQQQMEGIYCESHQFNSSIDQKMFVSDQAREIVKAVSQAVDPEGVVTFEENTLYVWSFDAQKALQMKDAGLKQVQEREITLGPEHQQAVRLQTFDQLLLKIENKNEGMLVIDFDKQKNYRVLLHGVMESINDDCKQIEDFLDKNRIVREEYNDIDPQDYIILIAFLKQTRHNELFYAEAINYEADKRKLSITLMAEDMNVTKTCLEGFQNGTVLVVKSRDFVQPSFGKYIQSEQGKRCLETIQREKVCKVEGIEIPRNPGRVQSPPVSSSMETKQQKPSAARDFTQPQPPAKDAEVTQPKFVPPIKPRIFVNKMSDITKCEHHFFVNSSNTSLDLSQGQVSKALIETGGPRILEECAAKYPKGITYGDIAITGPGRSKQDEKKDGKPRLDCKMIIHCCLPHSDNETEMKDVLRKTVQKCLACADEQLPQYDRKAIGFPALGCGNLGYPPQLVAKTMFETIMEYGHDHPDTHVVDVYIILHKKDTYNFKVFSEEETNYLRLTGGNKEQGDENYMKLNIPEHEGIESCMYLLIWIQLLLLSCLLHFNAEPFISFFLS